MRKDPRDTRAAREGALALAGVDGVAGDAEGADETEAEGSEVDRLIGAEVGDVAFEEYNQGCANEFGGAGPGGVGNWRLGGLVDELAVADLGAVG